MLRATTYSQLLSLLAALLVLPSSVLIAQNSVRIHGSVGLAAGDNYPANAQSLAVYWHRESITYSARFFHTDRVTALFNWNSPAPNLDQVQSFTLSVGYSREEWKARYGVSAGLGVTRGWHNQLRSSERFTVPSALIDVWGGMFLNDYIGLGLTFVGNLNARRSIGAASASVFVRVF